MNPSIESNYAFLAAVYAGVGIAFLFIAWKFKWANMLVLACLVVFLGGVGRIIFVGFARYPALVAYCADGDGFGDPAVSSGVVRLD